MPGLTVSDIELPGATGAAMFAAQAAGVASGPLATAVPSNAQPTH
jgi:hypothetical protein